MLKTKRDNFRKITLDFLPKTEIWGCHPKYDKYLISNTGLIKSFYNGKLMKLSKNANGYNIINVTDLNNVRRSELIHRMVMQTFSNYVPFELGYEVNHMDGNKNNNNLSNLEWVTRAENLQHARDNKLFKSLIGEQNGNCKFTDAQMFEMREFKKLGFKVKDITKSYNISKSQITKLLRGER